MKLSEKFLERCRIFHEREKRHEEFPKAHEKGGIRGIKHILEKWNPRVWGRVDEEDAIDQVRDALEESREVLDRLSGKDLLESDLRDCPDEIKEAFKAFEKRKAIKITGASKALHLLNQDLFVMWDIEIRRNYHERLHKKKIPFGLHHAEKDHEKCYYAFLLDCKELAKELQRERTPQELVSDHLNDLSPSTRETYEKYGYRETIPKMIDEFNYVTFTFREAELRKPWEV